MTTYRFAIWKEALYLTQHVQDVLLLQLHATFDDAAEAFTTQLKLQVSLLGVPPHVRLKPRVV